MISLYINRKDFNKSTDVLQVYKIDVYKLKI